MYMQLLVNGIHKTSRDLKAFQSNSDLRWYLLSETVVEEGEFVSQITCCSVAMSKEKHLCYQPCVGDHHSHRPEMMLQVIWELHSASITEWKWNSARKCIGYSYWYKYQCNSVSYPGFIVIHTAQLEFIVISLPSNRNLVSHTIINT